MAHKIGNISGVSKASSKLFKCREFLKPPHGRIKLLGLQL